MPDPSQSKAYSKRRQQLTLIHLFLTPALLALTFMTPISITIKEIAGQWIENRYAVVAIYFLLYSLFMLVIDFPLTYYSGYALEKKYDLSNHSLGSWFADLMKRSILSFLLSTGLILALYFLIWKYPNQWWVLAWAGFAAVSYIMGKLFPVLIVPLFYKYGNVENEMLKERIHSLADRYKLPIQNVYSINLSRTTKKANAAFMGMGKTKRVVLSDTLLEHFTNDEIETVVAHELGHYRHKDIWKQLIFGLISSFLGFALAFNLMDPLAQHFGLGGVSNVASLPLLFFVFYLFYLVLTPLQNGFSRYVERAADLFALKAFPQPEVFIACMRKLAEVNLADPEPPGWYEWFFYDHPAIGKRIQMAERLRDGKP